MSKKRKTTYVLVCVSHADHVSAADVRKEVKTRVNEACCWKHEEGDVKITSAIPAPKSARQEMVTRKRYRKYSRTNLAYLKVT